MHTLPLRPYQALPFSAPIASLARNASLLALVCAAHGLVGWGLWVQGQASITPPKPFNTVEVLLLPATPAHTTAVPNKALSSAPTSVPNSAPKRAAAQPVQPARSVAPKPTAQAAPESTPKTAPSAAPTAAVPTPETTTPTAATATAAAAPSNSAAEARSAGAGEGNTTTAPSFGAAYLNNPSPAYPAVSRQLNEQGKVLLRVHVGADGQVLDLEIKSSSGHARLDKSARDAVQRWRFVPAQQGGQAVAAWVLVPISFSLKG